MRMKPRPAGSPHEALSRFFDEIGVKRAADFEDKRPSTIYNELNPDLPGDISFARVSRLTEHFGSATAAAYLARRAGGIFVPLPPANASPTDAEALIRVAETSAHAVSAGWTAIADGVITPAEREALRQHIDRGVAALESFRLMLDGGEDG